MSINLQIQRIATAKENLKAAINAKGGELTDELIDAYAAAVTNLPEGEETVAGYIVNTDGVLTFQPLESGAQAEVVSALKIVDTGVDEPQYDGVSMNFYKCASIDTVNHTWTGYKAVQNSYTKVWSFEQTLTSDILTYFDANSIVVNGVYNSDGSISANLYEGLPTDGIVLYHPLSSSISTLPSGQNVTDVGSPSFSTVDGIPCCTFDGNSYIKMEDLTTVPTGNNSRTVSFWMKTAALSGSDDYGYVGYGNASSGQWFITLSSDVDGFGCSLYGEDLYLPTSDTPVDVWHHIAITLDSGVLSIYVDGTKKSHQNVSANTSSSGILAIGASPYSSSNISKKLVGSMAAVRIYNRALSATEITALANEFAPTAE